MKDWFSVHKDGLRQTNEPVIERRGFGIIGGELWQNVRDTTATECIFNIEKVPGKPRIQIEVIDNGEGFQDLTHAWTMFAPSAKKDDPTLAGRFNIGEKMVLSFAYEASVETTSGTVTFDSNGRSEYPRRKRDVGTRFFAELACTTERYDQLIEYMNRIIVPEHITLIVNGTQIASRKPIQSWDETLMTEIGEDLRSSKRKTVVEVYEVSGDEVPFLYELGIPVVETEDKWHINITQKVPLNKDRDNVSAAYLRSVRVSVLNNMHQFIEPDDVDATWVNEATSDDRCSNEAAETFRINKYGKNSVAWSPNPEANAEAMAGGFTVIPNRGLTRGQRDNLKTAGTLVTSSEQFPRAGKGAYSTDPNASPVDIVPRERWTEEMATIVEYSEQLCERLVGSTVTVTMVNCKTFVGKRWVACYSPGRLDFNLWTLGKKWFANNLTPTGVTEAVDDLLIHELGHHYEGNHLSHKYHEALTKLGAKLKRIALEDPDFFKKFVAPVKETSNEESHQV